jgi:hypothetical protein
MASQLDAVHFYDLVWPNGDMMRQMFTKQQFAYVRMHQDA